jgi:hypothetical protein
MCTPGWMLISRLRNDHPFLNGKELNGHEGMIVGKTAVIPSCPFNSVREPESTFTETQQFEAKLFGTSPLDNTSHTTYTYLTS